MCNSGSRVDRLLCIVDKTLWILPIIPGCALDAAVLYCAISDVTSPTAVCACSAQLLNAVMKLGDTATPSDARILRTAVTAGPSRLMMLEACDSQSAQAQRNRHASIIVSTANVRQNSCLLIFISIPISFLANMPSVSAYVTLQVDSSGDL